MHPGTGAIWENEHGPLGGDELNIILPGTQLRLAARHLRHRLRRHEDQRRDVARRSRSAVRVLGAVDRDVRADVLHRRSVSAVEGQRLRRRDVRGAHARHRPPPAHRHQRAGRPIKREPLLTELRQRIRDVRQGPDGLLYVLTDEDAGMVLRLEPGAAARRLPNTAGVGDGPPPLRGARRRGEQEVLDRARRREVRARSSRLGRSSPGQASAGTGRPEVPRRARRARAGESTGGTEGSVVNHVAFRVPSLTQVEAAGLKVARLNGFPGVASVMTPEGERIELFENAATNLTFTQDAGFDDAVAQPAQPAAGRADRVPPRPPVCAGGSGGRRQSVVREGVRRGSRQAVELRRRRSARHQPELFERSAGRLCRPGAGCSTTSGSRSANLPAFCKRLGAMGVTLDVPYTWVRRVAAARP